MATTSVSMNLPAISAVILDPDRKLPSKSDSFNPLINQVLDRGVILLEAGQSLQEHQRLSLMMPKASRGSQSRDHGHLQRDETILAILMLEEAAKVKFRIVHSTGIPPS